MSEQQIIPYNYTFHVRYFEIKQELLKKVAEMKEDFVYTEEDVNIVCEQLYIDELINVFQAQSFEDNKIDSGSDFAFSILCKNTEFEHFYQELLTRNKHFSENEETFIDDSHIKSFIVAGMFSQNMFYITHLLVSQQIINNSIDNQLLNLFKEKCYQYVVFN
jgi:hypothetical protein